MKIQYIRKLTASYMVLAQCEELQEWEKKMIAHAPKGNIVFAECVQENGEKYLWYNITGKQALDAVLETETFSYDMLCNVLNGIYEAVQQLEGMLLPAQSILLSADFFLLLSGESNAAAGSLPDVHGISADTTGSFG